MSSTHTITLFGSVRTFSIYDPNTLAARGFAEQAEAARDAADAFADDLASIADVNTYHEDLAASYTDQNGKLIASIDRDGNYRAAGGTAVSGERLDRMIDEDGNTTGHLINPQYIREFPRKRQQLLDGDSVRLAVVLGPGDSYARDFGRMEKLARQWKAEMGNGGPGWCGVGFPPGVPGSPQGNVDDAELSVALTGSWTGQFTTNYESPDLCSATSSTAGDKITFTYSGTDTIAIVGLHHVGSLWFKYRWNGGAQVEVNNIITAGEGAVFSLGSIPAGAWTLEIELVSGTGQVSGINALRGVGVVVHNLGVNGSPLASWSNIFDFVPGARTRLAEAWARLGGVDTIVPMIGANDQLQNIAYPKYDEGIPLFVEQVARMVNPGADILWMIQPENGVAETTAPLRQRELGKRVKRHAFERKFTVLDLQPLFGESYAQYGDAGTHRQLFVGGGDVIHPNAAGNAVIRNACSNALKYRS